MTLLLKHHFHFKKRSSQHQQILLSKIHNSMWKSLLLLHVPQSNQFLKCFKKLWGNSGKLGLVTLFTNIRTLYYVILKYIYYWVKAPVAAKWVFPQHFGANNIVIIYGTKAKAKMAFFIIISSQKARWWEIIHMQAPILVREG